VVDLFATAERLGYQSGWVAQHHLRTDHGRLPSPLVLLAAAARRTERIHLGVAVAVLPLEDPLRLAEDALVLDALSGGRVQLGLGSGAPLAGEFAAFGRDADRRHEVYDEHLAVLRGALAGEDLAGRLWDSSLRPEVLADGAAAGHGVLLGVGPAAAVQVGLTGHGHRRIAAVRGVFPAADRAEAVAGLAQDVAGYLPLHVRAGWAPHDRISTEELLHLMNVQYGTPADITASLLADPVVAGPATHLIAAVQAESSTLAQAAHGLEVLATRVAPGLGWRP
jgi:alkanesulfonate monooxygenase SsuD/methylene tetrahydromethanopterin reductase-like flavin-dependent oxidoreductase (luciferase family)